MSEAFLEKEFLESSIQRFQSLKEMGEKAMNQLSVEDLFWFPDPESNSIAVIVQHLHGNMISRWTDFLTTDGDKTNRDRDGEFLQPEVANRETLMKKWNEGWDCLLATLRSLEPGDLAKNILIRGQELTVIDAIHRQLSHYGYHIGQVVYLARMKRGAGWKTLSIPKNKSRQYRPVKKD